MKRISKGIFFGVLFQALTATVSACPECRARVGGGIYNQDFLLNLFALMLPVIVVVASGVGLYFADEITERLKEQVSEWRTKEPAVR